MSLTTERAEGGIDASSKVAKWSLAQEWLQTESVAVHSSAYPHETRLRAELNLICHLLALLGAHYIFHVSGLRVKQVRVKITQEDPERGEEV